MWVKKIHFAVLFAASVGKRCWTRVVLVYWTVVAESMIKRQYQCWCWYWSHWLHSFVDTRMHSKHFSIDWFQIHYHGARKRWTLYQCPKIHGPNGVISPRSLQPIMKPLTPLDLPNTPYTLWVYCRATKHFDNTSAAFYSHSSGAFQCLQSAFYCSRTTKLQADFGRGLQLRKGNENCSKFFKGTTLLQSWLKSHNSEVQFILLLFLWAQTTQWCQNFAYKLFRQAWVFNPVPSLSPWTDIQSLKQGHFSVILLALD